MDLLQAPLLEPMPLVERPAAAGSLSRTGDASLPLKPPSCLHPGHRRRSADSVGDPDGSKEIGLRGEDDACPRTESVEATFSQKPSSCWHLGHRRRLADSVGDPDDGKETGLREEDDAIPSMETP